MTLPLQVRNLRKNYGNAAAVQDLSFEVHEGEVYGLLGPNGAGKTTTISIVTDLETPTSGTATVFGLNVAEAPLEAKKRFGLVHQEIINSGFFDIVELLQFQSGYHGLRRNGERIDYLIHRLGLYEHRHKKVKQLSGGMKRRLMIAKALVHSPRLLLLDEPTAGVDLTLRENLWDFVRELRAEGVAILLTTHYLEEAELLCDRVGILNRGRLEASGPTAEVVRRFTQKKVIVETVDANRREFTVAPQATLAEILSDNGIDPHTLKDVRVEEGSLEDAFRQVLTAPEEGGTP